MDWIIENGYFKYSEKSGRIISDLQIGLAAANGHLEILRSIPVERISSKILLEGIKSGNVETVKYILNYQPASEKALSLAVRFGYGDLVKLLLERGCSPSEHVLEHASKLSREDILKMLLDSPECPQCDTAFEYAAECGLWMNLLFEKSEYSNPNMLIYSAICNNEIEVIEYLWDRDHRLNLTENEIKWFSEMGFKESADFFRKLGTDFGNLEGP